MAMCMFMHVGRECVECGGGWIVNAVASIQVPQTNHHHCSHPTSSPTKLPSPALNIRDDPEPQISEWGRGHTPRCSSTLSLQHNLLGPSKAHDLQIS